VQRQRLNAWIVLLAVAAVAFAMVSRPRDGGNPFGAYATAALVADEGLGDLRLGETTLGSFLARFGPGLPAALYGDDTGLEFAFARAGLSFRFWLEGACAGTVQAMRGTALRALGDAVRFSRDHPECVDQRLSAIEVAAGASERATFWRGEATAGVRLGMPREAALERLATVPGALGGALGLGPETEEAMLVRFVEADGLLVWFAVDRSSSGGGAWIVTRLGVAAR
jgi:hypothetical protein